MASFQSLKGSSIAITSAPRPEMPTPTPAALKPPKAVVSHSRSPPRRKRVSGKSWAYSWLWTWRITEREKPAASPWVWLAWMMRWLGLWPRWKAQKRSVVRKLLPARGGASTMRRGARRAATSRLNHSSWAASFLWIAPTWYLGKVARV